MNKENSARYIQNIEQYQRKKIQQPHNLRFCSLTRKTASSANWSRRKASPAQKKATKSFLEKFEEQEKNLNPKALINLFNELIEEEPQLKFSMSELTGIGLRLLRIAIKLQNQKNLYERTELLVLYKKVADLQSFQILFFNFLDFDKKGFNFSTFLKEKLEGGTFIAENEHVLDLFVQMVKEKIFDPIDLQKFIWFISNRVSLLLSDSIAHVFVEISANYASLRIEIIDLLFQQENKQKIIKKKIGFSKQSSPYLFLLNNLFLEEKIYNLAIFPQRTKAPAFLSLSTKVSNFIQFSTNLCLEIIENRKVLVFSVVLRCLTNVFCFCTSESFLSSLISTVRLVKIVNIIVEEAKEDNVLQEEPILSFVDALHHSSLRAKTKAALIENVQVGLCTESGTENLSFSCRLMAKMLPEIQNVLPKFNLFLSLVKRLSIQSKVADRIEAAAACLALIEHPEVFALPEVSNLCLSTTICGLRDISFSVRMKTADLACRLPEIVLKQQNIQVVVSSLLGCGLSNEVQLRALTNFCLFPCLKENIEVVKKCLKVFLVTYKQTSHRNTRVRCATGAANLFFWKELDEVAQEKALKELIKKYSLWNWFMEISSNRDSKLSTQGIRGLGNVFPFFVSDIEAADLEKLLNLVFKPSVRNSKFQWNGLQALLQIVTSCSMRMKPRCINEDFLTRLVSHCLVVLQNENNPNYKVNASALSLLLRVYMNFYLGKPEKIIEAGQFIESKLLDKTKFPGAHKEYKLKLTFKRRLLLAWVALYTKSSKNSCNNFVLNAEKVNKLIDIEIVETRGRLNKQGSDFIKLHEELRQLIHAADILKLKR
eukprot:snap_masked-scaffold_14-processed-gene-3.40-mRNA-1 protein AED:1.00 eAED:1.00 QI:0/-1/0/0/-1/1/1/0/824